MRYSFISAAVLAFVSAVSAAEPSADFDPMSVPTSATDSVKAGDDYTIKWTAPAKYTGTVTLKLLEGASAGTLALDETAIATGVQNSANEYTWSIPSDIEIFAVYGIQISWDSDPTIFQWSFPFTITSASVSSSSAVVTAAGSSSTSVSSLVSAASTKTVQISTNSAYTSTSVSSSAEPTSTSASFTTSVVVAVVDNTTSSVTAAGTGSPAVATSNTTLSTSATLKPSSTSSATGTAPATVTNSSAAVAKVARGGLAVLGGAILAFAL